MSRAGESMDFPVSADWRAFRPLICRRPNNDVAGLHSAGLCCVAAMDIMASVAQFIGIGGLKIIETT